MMNDKMEEINTAGNTPSDQTESTCVIQCMAVILNALFGMEAYVGQVLIVYHCLYPNLNDYEIIKKLLDDWNVYHIKLIINIYGRCFLIVFNKEKVFLIDKDDGHIFYPLWKDCRAILPKDIGNYLVRVNDWIYDISYDPEFKDKGWCHYFDEDREHYWIVDKWCSYEDLKPFDQAEGIL